mgnify:CR=1 FL=1
MTNNTVDILLYEPRKLNSWKVWLLLKKCSNARFDQLIQTGPEEVRLTFKDELSLDDKDRIAQALSGTVKRAR